LTAHINVIVVGAKDRQLDELLRSAGFKSVSVQESDLPALAQHESVPGNPLLLDMRGQSTLPTSLLAFRQKHSSIGVVIVASTLQPALMLEAMRAGVGEFLAEPLVRAELAAAIARVTTRSSVAGSVFAFLGAKGGVGTTTTAVNVATELARLERNGTLFVDLHPAYGDAAVFLGAEPRFSVLDALENTHRLDETFFRGLVVRTKAGPDLLASSDHATVTPVDARRIRALIDFASRLYRYVVLDCPRSDTAVLDSLETSSSIVVVANQEVATVRGAGRMAATLRQRYGKERVKVVVSRFDTHAEIGQTDVERVVGGTVKHLLPSDYRVALQALNSGVPIALGNHNKLSGSFRRLARDLAGLPGDTDAPEQGPGGLLGLFGGRRGS
jgi:pilus assembly protein CpaE